MKTYQSTVNYAHPTDPDRHLEAGEVFDADESDEEVQAAVRGGYFIPHSGDAEAVFTSDTPDESWTKDRLRTYAEQEGIPVADNATKADMLTAVTAQRTTGEPSS